MSRSDIPWQITDAAVEDFCDVTKRDPTNVDTFVRAEMQLVDRLKSSMRFKKLLESGCQLWRCGDKPRIYLVVDPDQKKLVAVRPEHRRVD